MVLWVSGCTISCEGCQNPETWSFFAGKPFDDNAKRKLFELMEKPWVKGLTLSGGHPLEIYNMVDVYELTKEVKENMNVAKRIGL